MTDWGSLIDSAGVANDTPLPPVFGPGGYQKRLDQYGNRTDGPQQDWGGLIDSAGSSNVQASAAGQQQEGEPSWPETFATAKQNMPSPMEYVKSQFTNPIEDVKNVGNLVSGTAQYLTGAPESPEQDQAKELGRHYLNYFSEKGLKENISKHPTETATDFLSLALPTKLPAGGLVERGLAKADELGAQSLKHRAAAAIEDAKDSGVHFTQPFMGELSNKFRAIAGKYGYRENKHTLVKDALRQADLLSEGLPSFGALHNLRQDINDAAGSRLASERNIAMEMKTQLDSVLEGLEKGTPEQIAQVVHAPPGTDPGQLAKRFKAGLTAYGAAKRAQEIGTILDKAGVGAFNWSQSGAANAIRTKFRQLYLADKKLRGFAPDEQKLIRDIAAGTLTDHVLNLASKAAIRGPVSFGVTHLVGGGFAGQTLIGGAGELAKRALDRRQLAKVERLQHHILNKGETALRQTIGETVYDHMNGTATGKAAIIKWIRSRGDKVATRALALAIARETHRPDLFPRINAELSQQTME